MREGFKKMPPGPAYFWAKADLHSPGAGIFWSRGLCLGTQNPGFLCIFPPTAIWPTLPNWRIPFFPFLNKVHSSGPEFPEKWNGCYEEKLVVTEKNYLLLVRCEATSLLCKDGWTYKHTCPSLQERERKIHPKNLLQVPAGFPGWNWGKVLRFLFC